MNHDAGEVKKQKTVERELVSIKQARFDIILDGKPRRRLVMRRSSVLAVCGGLVLRVLLLAPHLLGLEVLVQKIERLLVA